MGQLLIFTGKVHLTLDRGENILRLSVFENYKKGFDVQGEWPSPNTLHIMVQAQTFRIITIHPLSRGHPLSTIWARPKQLCEF